MNMKSPSLTRRARLALTTIVAVIALAAPLRLAFAQTTMTCSPSSNTIAFGPYDVLAGTTVPAVGSFTVSCTYTSAFGGAKTVNYTVTIPAPGTTARNMKPPSGTDVIAYTLYTDSARTMVWGDGAGGTYTITGSMNVPRNSTKTSAAINYYGLITPGGQDVSAASPGPPPTTYSQALTLTVTFTCQAPFFGTC